MTDVDALAGWFPGVGREVLEAIVDELDEPTPENVAVVLDSAADRGHLPPEDHLTLLARQREDALEVAACETCGKMFLGEDVDAAQRSVNGHKSSHRDEADADEPETVSDVEKRLEEQTDREAGEYPNAFEAVPDLEEVADAEREAEDLEADGGGE